MPVVVLVILVVAFGVAGLYGFALVGRIDNRSLRRQGRPEHPVAPLRAPWKRVPPE